MMDRMQYLLALKPKDNYIPCEVSGEKDAFAENEMKEEGR